MGKRLLKFISIQMALVILFSMTALADSSITGEGTATGTSPSNFSVDEDVIGSGATVVIPASLPLTYNESTDSYQVASSVGVYGDMQEHMSVRVSTPSVALYRQDGVDAEAPESDNTIAGHVRFGDIKDDVCSAGWSSAEMAEGLADDHANMKTVPLIITVASHNIENVGDYEASVEFTIQSACIGMYSDVTVASQNDDDNSGMNRRSSNSDTRWQLAFKDTSITSYNFTQLTPSGNATEVTMYSAMNVSNSTAITNFKTSAANVKYIQMNTGDFLKYQVSIDLDNINKTNNWLRGVYNLKVLVIDSNFDANHITYESGNGYDGAQDSDTCFYGTTAPVGNALIFMKDVTDDGYFMYVPHIVYHGTIAQWRAASGASDWIFGNAYNTVTVHCTDGTIEY